MPGKHNAGGCGCCGSDCWSCSGVIASVTVDGTATSNPCCELGDGTYVLDSGACTDSWGILRPYYPGCTVTVGSPTVVELTESETVGADANLQYAQVCDGPQSYTTNGVSNEYALVIRAYAVQIQYSDVAGTPTVTVTLTQNYREILTGYDPLNPGAGCGFSGGSVWILTDVYTLSVTDCDTLDGIEIPHTSRSMTTDSSNPGDTTTIYYGPGGIFPTWPYSFCAAPTVTINLVP